MKTWRIAFLSLLLAAVAAPQWLAAQVTETYTFTTNRLVPDGNPAGLSDVRTLNSAITNIGSVTVHLKTTGEFNGDLYAYLVHSNGFTVLLNRVGKTVANSAGYADSGLDVTFQTGAANGDIHTYENVTTPVAGLPLTGTWQPDERYADPAVVTDATNRTSSLTNFNGLNASGAWTLYLADLQSGGTNELTEWSVTITGTATPTIAWTNPADIVYGTALGAGQLDATATYNSTAVPGVLTYSPPAGAVLNAGASQTLSVTFTPTDTTTYATVTTNVTINVDPAPLTVATAAQNKTYGQTVTFGAGSAQFTSSGLQNGDTIGTVTLAVSGNGGAANAPVSGSPYTITPSAATGGTFSTANYTITYQAGSLTVGQAPLTITASAQGKVYGQTAAFGAGSALFTSSGLQNSETIGSVTLAVTGNGGAANAAVSGSPYTITPSAATGGTFSPGNYSITYDPGSLTVSQAPLTITASAQSKVYGQTVTFGAGSALFTSSGLQNNENIGSVTLAVSGNGGAASATVSGSPYTITPSAALGGTFSAGNYAITYDTGQLTVSKASTTAAVASSANPALPGAAVTFTTTITAVAPGAGAATGTVNYRIDGVIRGAGTLSAAVALFATNGLSHGPHTIVAEYAGDGNFTGATNSLSPSEVINTPPVAGSFTIQRYATQGTKVSLASILATCSDADGDTLNITVSSTSANGGTITVKQGWVFYEPATGFTNADSFTYTVTDGEGGSAQGTITVAILADNTVGQNLTITSLGNGSYLISGNGVPNYSYTLQHTASLSPANWQNVTGGTVTANSLGAFQFTDTPTGGEGYYRTIYP